MMKRTILTALTVCVCFFSCTDEDDTTGTNEQLSGNWKLSFWLENGDMAFAIPESPVTQFSVTNGLADSLNFSGISVCNSYFGSAVLGNENEIRLGEIGVTKRACATDSLNEFESQYLRMLGTVRTYAISGDTLRLSSETGDSYLSFTPKDN